MSHSILKSPCICGQFRNNSLRPFFTAVILKKEGLLKELKWSVNPECKQASKNGRMHLPIFHACLSLLFVKIPPPPLCSNSVANNQAQMMLVRTLFYSTIDTNQYTIFCSSTHMMTMHSELLDLHPNHMPNYRLLA